MPDATLDHIFGELRRHEERARASEETRDARLATLIALSGAVLGLLVASLPDSGLSTAGVVAFCLAGGLFTLAILTAIQFVLRAPWVAPFFGGALELVPEVGLEEFSSYLTPEFQQSEKEVLQKRVLPAMHAAIGARRRNAARKERCLDLTIRLIAGGVFVTAGYGAILVL